MNLLAIGISPSKSNFTDIFDRGHGCAEPYVLPLGNLRLDILNAANNSIVRLSFMLKRRAT
ncbi:hypothetical protein EYZ11_008687 [Aspergillus tanneri]|uniref:Uncharacterized protein n=1 Tax=Aspergillus tanneri TaxID=1220188 RepID=A0A4S3J9T3_9EURO|nr:hypothetical protein EYZ11_008687 [Aspergillus tanneri]